MTTTDQNQKRKSSLAHARQFLINDYHFSSTAAITGKELLKKLSKENVIEVIEFLQMLPDIHFTSNGAKSEAKEIVINLKKYLSS